MSHILLQNAIEDRKAELLRFAGSVAQRNGIKLWAVGGIVRDALLATPATDIDLASEAPAPYLASILVEALGGRSHSQTRFGTIKVELGDIKIDLATTRDESYPIPGQLPVVRMSDIGSDLARRDFTMNAMAMSLAPNDFGDLLDPYGGVADLNDAKIRVIHPRSFKDDPTRMFRAVRYAIRLDFDIEFRTMSSMHNDKSLLTAISPARLHREIIKVSKERNGARAFLLAQRNGLLSTLYPSARVDELRTALQRTRSSNLTDLELLGVLSYPLSSNQVQTLVKRWGFSRREETLMHAVTRIRMKESQISRALPSTIDNLLVNAPNGVAKVMGVVSGDRKVRAAIRRYLRRVSLIGEPLSGRDLMNLGIPEGPQIGNVLRAFREAQLDGKTHRVTDKARLIRRLFEEL